MSTCAVGTPNVVVVQPLYEVTGDVAKVREYLLKFTEAVRQGVDDGKESGCVHFDFCWQEDDSHFQVREGYRNAKAVSDHFANVGHLFADCLALGVRMVRMEVLGPAEELKDEGLRALIAEYKPVYYFVQ
jgi:quinol monooxygenase YgiN